MNTLISYYKRARFIENIKIFLAWFYSIGTITIGLFINVSFLILSILSFIIISLFLLISNPFSSADVSDSNRLLFNAIALLLAVIISLPVIAYYRIWKELRERYKELNNFSNLDELPPKLTELVNQRIDALSQKMTKRHQNLLSSYYPIRHFLERRNFTAAPSMVFSRGRINLIFPLGFFKLIKSDPEAADAILVHELAHFFQKDSSLLFKIRCYYQIAPIWENYFLLFLINGILWGVPRFFILLGILKNCRSINTQSKSVSLVPCFEYDTFPVLISLILFTLVTILIDLFVRNEIHNMLVDFLYKRVLMAEKSADLFAMCVTSPAALKRFLINCLNDSDAWYAMHPARRERINQAEKYESLLK
jgi:hypothetical protein